MGLLFNAEIRQDPEAQERARAWIAALRSGRYTQTVNSLRNEGGFCCLGVACDVFDPARWEEGGDGEFRYFDMAGILPAEVQDSLYLNGATGIWGPRGPSESLMHLNDGGSSFAAIADVIERELEEVLA